METIHLELTKRSVVTIENVLGFDIQNTTRKIWNEPKETVGYWLGEKKLAQSAMDEVRSQTISIVH